MRKATPFQSGDSLAGIALRNQVSVRQIIEANDLENSDLINPGQVITIPPASANELATTSALSLILKSLTVLLLKILTSHRLSGSSTAN